MTIPQEIGLQIPQILLPSDSIDLHKWAVIACDQFTSEPEYWQEVEKIVGTAPSTYHMILPEIYLGTSEEEKRIKSTHSVMKDYLNANMFKSIDGFIFILRTINDRTRRGLMVCLDLEHYDFSEGSQTLIRASEGTIIDRLPPRIRIREQAALECPHIMVLFDDPLDTVFGPLDAHLENFEELYNFDLMLGSGHLRGLAVKDRQIQQHILQALQNLVAPETFADKYALEPGQYPPLLFAMGDGNHSLATAKAIWEHLKPAVGMDHPARYALVEIENVHDPALTFEPIHRLLFDLNTDIYQEMQAFWGNRLVIRDIDTQEKWMLAIEKEIEGQHQFGMVTNTGYHLIEVHNAKETLPVGTLQKFLDAFLEKKGAQKIDYIHGIEVLLDKGKLNGNAGFYVPGMHKSDLFKTVILEGALPRKTFSMGTAKTKRFYMECRQIQPA